MHLEHVEKGKKMVCLSPTELQALVMKVTSISARSDRIDTSMQGLHDSVDRMSGSIDRMSGSIDRMTNNEKKVETLVASLDKHFANYIRNK